MRNEKIGRIPRKKNEKKMALKCLQTNQIDILKMFALEKNS